MVFARHQYGSATGTHVGPPSWTLLPPPHPPDPSRLSQSAGVLGHTSDLHWLSILHMVIYMSQCSSLKSSHPLLLPLSLQVCSLHEFFTFLLFKSASLWCFITAAIADEQTGLDRSPQVWGWEGQVCLPLSPLFWNLLSAWSGDRFSDPEVLLSYWLCSGPPELPLSIAFRGWTWHKTLFCFAGRDHFSSGNSDAPREIHGDRAGAVPEGRPVARAQFPAWIPRFLGEGFSALLKGRRKTGVPINRRIHPPSGLVGALL